MVLKCGPGANHSAPIFRYFNEFPLPSDLTNVKVKSTRQQDLFRVLVNFPYYYTKPCPTPCSSRS